MEEEEEDDDEDDFVSIRKRTTTATQQMRTEAPQPSSENRLVDDEDPYVLEYVCAYGEELWRDGLDCDECEERDGGAEFVTVTYVNIGSTIGAS